MRRRTLVRLISPVGLSLLIGCTVRLIAPYDATLDNSMTQVQQGTETFFAQMKQVEGTDAANYDNNKTYYLHTEAALKTMLTRAQAVPKSERVAAQIESIEKTVEIMERMHERDKALNDANLTGDQKILEGEFQAFFSLELGLRAHAGGPAGAAMAPTQ